MISILYQDTMDEYYVIEVAVNNIVLSDLDHVARDEFNCQGIEEFSLDESRVDEILGERSYSGADIPLEVIQEVELKTNSTHDSTNKYYFSKKTDAQGFQQFLDLKLNVRVEIQSFNSKDWNVEWRKSFQKIIVSEEIEIIPSWEKIDGIDNPAAIYIYPGQGFGTGNHETTYLCLKLYSELINANINLNNCLDFGCGSGILGLAYARDFTGPVDMYDIDQAALENCQQNIDLNTLKSSQMNLLLPGERKVIEWQSYSLIFANILQNVLLSEVEFLANHLTEDGFLILSGLLKGQEKEVINAYEKTNSNLKAVKVISRGDWVAVLMEVQ